MYRNIGKKIKTLANILCWIGIVLSLIVALSVFFISGVPVNGEVYDLGILGRVCAAVLIAGLGCFFSWIEQFLLYGFGELIDKTSQIAENTRLMPPQ